MPYMRSGKLSLRPIGACQELLSKVAAQEGMEDLEDFIIKTETFMWGGLPELAIIARLWRVQFEVYNLDKSEKQIIGRSGRLTVILLYSQQHYMLWETNRKKATLIASSPVDRKALRGAGGGGRGRGDSPESQDIYLNGALPTDASNIVISVIKKRYAWRQALRQVPFGFRFIAPAGVTIERIRRAVAAQLKINHLRVQLSCANGNPAPQIFYQDDIVEVEQLPRNRPQQELTVPNRSRSRSRSRGPGQISPTLPVGTSQNNQEGQQQTQEEEAEQPDADNSPLGVINVQPLQAAGEEGAEEQPQADRPDAAIGSNDRPRPSRRPIEEEMAERINEWAATRPGDQPPSDSEGTTPEELRPQPVGLTLILPSIYHHELAAPRRVFTAHICNVRWIDIQFEEGARLEDYNNLFQSLLVRPSRSRSALLQPADELYLERGGRGIRRRHQTSGRPERRRSPAEGYS